MRDIIKSGLNSPVQVFIVAGLFLVAVLTILRPLIKSVDQETDVAAVQVSEAPESGMDEAVAQDQEYSIVVLPFTNLSDDPEQEYFAEGVAEDISNALVKLPDLRVIGRRSAFTFKGSEASIEEIGSALGVDYALEGTVRKQGDSVRVASQLLETQSGFTAWSGSYEGKLTDLFTLEADIARAVSAELDILFSVDEEQPLAGSLTVFDEAYEYFLQGRSLYRQRWGDRNIENALVNFEKAVALDPTFADAWAYLGILYYLQPVYVAGVNPIDARERAVEAARKAQSLKPYSATPYHVLGAVAFFQNKPLETLQLFEKAVDLEPNNPEVLAMLGMNLGMAGYTDEALEAFKKAVNLDPVHGLTLANSALVHINDGQIERAEILAKRAAALDEVSAWDVLARIAHAKGNQEGSMDSLLKVYELAGDTLSPSFANRVIWEAAARAMFEENEGDRMALRGMIDLYISQPDGIPNAPIYIMLGRTGSADLLFKAYQERATGQDAFWLGLWDGSEGSQKFFNHPEFPAFAERTGMADVWRTRGWPAPCKPVAGTDGTNAQFSCQ